MTGAGARSVAGVWQEASVPDGWFLHPLLPVSLAPLTKFSTFASEKYFVNRSAPASAWRGMDGREIWTSVQNFGAKFESINSVWALLFIIFIFPFYKSLKSSFQYCFPSCRQRPGLLHWLIWMVLPGGGWWVRAGAVNQQTAHVDIFYCRYFIHN